jgi:UDP-glucose 4-epimerase
MSTSETILVTGATGFLGRHVCRSLVQSGHTVIGVTRPGTSPRKVPPGAVTGWLEWDLAQPAMPDVPCRPTVIIHLAQSGRFREFPAGARDMFAVNVDATLQLLEFARRNNARRILYASTGGVYGPHTTPVREDTAIAYDDSGSFYTTTKRMAELICRDYSQFMSIGSLRLFFPYGPEQQPDRLIPRLIANIATGKPITLAGKDGLTINPIHVDDATCAIVHAVSSEIDVVNIAGLETISLRELGLQIGRLLGRAPVFQVEPARGAEMLCGDVQLMIEKLGIRPATSLSDGLASVVADMRLAKAAVPGL